ncbi:hypothetical protein BCV72DRAFT_235843 [Rhizopus microsporus var. microsporus]|uniref:Transposase n=2 Tax=Rhizopus microsporus TaxID=58291 RepID=A0A2G4SLH1_RHIZD|nr:uncharacterized protein RHIMIDRAFT_261873 [Rhizopus microsporus ATCC 52813]ORE01719.1 hypothetical protein BCV72DRAFT_235843 [Rhizopus microsporus var. microsporus]PHZ09620.1 hypothetical protein RHIMIDRAFT_261873 [Rhizopus microsporus ATCC 52813]
MLDFKVNTIRESFLHMRRKPSKLYAFIYSYTLRHLSKKGIVILVDEYRTSKVCSHCKNDLEDITVHSCTRYWSRFNSF